jgi:RNA polymerase sigma-70 factor (ECF subfamily)
MDTASAAEDHGREVAGSCMDSFASQGAQEEALLEQAMAGDRAALDALLGRHRDRLHRMISFRIDRLMRGRLDASDVLQDTYLEAYQRIAEYARNRKTSFFLWLRFLTRQKLVTLHRHHVGTQARDPRREVALADVAPPLATSESLAAALLGTATSPSQAAVRAELQAEVQAALNRMDGLDREVLVLRHFEDLANADVAVELGITEAAASKRYVRAAQRLSEALAIIRRSRSCDP